MRRLALPIIAAVSLAACGAAPGARAEESAPPRLMTVGGEGEASGVPDIAILSVGVETEGASAAEALSRNAARMSATIAKLKARGVADIEKVRIDLDPVRREEMMQKTGRRSVPQIYIGDTHVGGCDELYALDRAGKLEPLLRGE